MNKRFILSSLLSLLCLVQLPLANALDTAASPDSDLKQLIGTVSAKLKAGQVTEESLAPELAQFDALLKKYADQKTDAVARILVMKATLYVQVFKDFGKGIDLLYRVKNEFPKTTIAVEVDQDIEQLQLMQQAQKRAEALKVGAAFPAFSMQDLEGKPLTLDSYKGKVVLVDFWATWCGPCVAELPNVLAAYEKYHEKGFEIVGVSLDKDQAALTSFIKEKKITWRQYFDGQGWQNRLAQEYGVNSIPMTYLLDREGKILASDLRGPDLEAELAKQLGK